MMYRIFIILICSLATAACNDWRMWDTPAVRPHEEPLLIMDEQAVPLSDAEIAYRIADAKKFPRRWRQAIPPRLKRARRAI